MSTPTKQLFDFSSGIFVAGICTASEIEKIAHPKKVTRAKTFFGIVVRRSANPEVMPIGKARAANDSEGFEELFFNFHEQLKRKRRNPTSYY